MTKVEEARNGRKSLNTGTQGRKKLVVKSTPFRFHRPLGTRALSFSPSRALSLSSSAFLFFFDNIKRPLVAARAFIKSAPERKKASRALEGTAVRALRLSGLSSVLRDRSYLPTYLPTDRSIVHGKRLARERRIDQPRSELPPARSFFFLFFHSRMNIDVRS